MINEIIIYGFGFASIVIFLNFMWKDTEGKRCKNVKD
jgi:hypothetical protein